MIILWKYVRRRIDDENMKFQVRSTLAFMFFWNSIRFDLAFKKNFVILSFEFRALWLLCRPLPLEPHLLDFGFFKE